MGLDLSAPADNLRAFMKARASLDGTDSYTWFTGNVYAMMPGRNVGLFGIEGFNVARVVEADGGFDLLTREAVFYTDLATHEILRTWANPLNEQTVDVIHIWNEPVNQRIRLDGPRPFRAPVTPLGDDICFNADVFLVYPSPLPRAQFPDNSQNDLYQAAELFQFFCSRAEVEDETTTSAACAISWTRIAPWLPFMRMADAPGQLVYQCRGTKLGSYDELPAWIRDEVDATAPQFARAPGSFTEPNETSWTYFRKLSSSSAR